MRQNKTKNHDELMPRSEHETAAKEWAIEKQALIKSIKNAEQTVNNIVQHNNNSVSQLSSTLTRRTYLAFAFFVILMMSITVNIIMVINNIGGLK